MNYRGLKWQKFNFVIHPTELQEIFRKIDCFIAITNQRVEENYQITDKTSVPEQYNKYYNKITSGEKWVRENDWKLEIHTSLTNDPNIIHYEPFEKEEDGIIKIFKKAIQLKPVINITVFCLKIDSKDKFNISLYDSSGESNLGLQINYPREIYSIENQETIKTETFSNFRLYTDLVNSIKKIGKKAKASRKNKVSKPNFWLTERVIDDINNNYHLKNNSIRFI